MGLINKKVIHKSLGEGTIIEHEKRRITVRFQQGEKKFMYPNAFDGYLMVEDSALAVKIKKEMETIKTAEKLEKEHRNNQLLQKEHQAERTKQHSKSSHHSAPKGREILRTNIAFKCNYCDGGSSSEQIGFNGVCSDDIIRNNIEVEKRTWCSSYDCLCHQYLKGVITRNGLESSRDRDLVCYESQMLRDWRAFAGFVHKGERKGQPMKLNQVQVNSLCVLTTRDPKSNERERYIFGVFLVGDAYEGDNRDEGYVSAKTKFCIKLSPQESHKMLFWNYHANDNNPKVAVWSSGLHRYYNDEQAIQILQDIKEVKQGTKDEELANEFLVYFAQINNIDMSTITEKNGALLRV